MLTANADMLPLINSLLFLMPHQSRNLVLFPPVPPLIHSADKQQDWRITPKLILFGLHQFVILMVISLIIKKITWETKVNVHEYINSE